MNLQEFAGTKCLFNSFIYLLAQLIKDDTHIIKLNSSAKINLPVD